MSAFSGRIIGNPSTLLHEEVLAPQFTFEVQHLLPFYVAIEKALLAEYVRMGLLPSERASRIASVLNRAEAELPTADPAANMSDIAFALERFVTDSVKGIDAWHVDRSRNDLQACAQLLFLRGQTRLVARSLMKLCETVHSVAAAHTGTIMPGFTHYQAAQIITPAFYLSAISEHLLHSLRRLLCTYDGVDASPLGSGAMSGQELSWDRDRLARLLGFDRSLPHALTGIASRRATLETTSELSLLGVAISRFVTDLLTWSSSNYEFLALPDSLSGISSAMPQKKNYPVLERIRGKSAHLSAFHLDAVLGQRNTPYTNLVEVSKEAGTYLYDACQTADLVLRLLACVLENATFDVARMRAACEREFLGGFSLANLLTLREGVPSRQAQIIAGRYITAACAAGLSPRQFDVSLLLEAARDIGVDVCEPSQLLEAFNVDQILHRLQTAGSANPASVRALLSEQSLELAAAKRAWAVREQRCLAAARELDGNFPAAEDMPEGTGRVSL